MNDLLLDLLPDYGVPFLTLVTLLSCLALPVPASLVMMAAGGFAASGDLSPTAVVLGALGGAVLGDQAGFWLGRSGSGLVTRIEAKGGRQAHALGRATRLTRDRGSIAVFLSRWLLSPLGPYVNLASGAARMGWRGFTLAAIAGEAVWVTVYVGLGAGAGHNLAQIWPMISDGLGLLAALAVAALALLRLRHLLHSYEVTGGKVRRKAGPARP
ncbi:DedA family protein [Thalassobius vesicularis]|uniref:DedA family protein n=1 Tax=Thalassobius vesicularis TaxID=1294297 RepID=A0A4S3M9H3_9RHOB|nr:DedA family protein [Thalassobius vesicularis]THD74718.1 DedA family protein [Thalassobius vesicularis]